MNQLNSMARILKMDEFLEAFIVDSHPLDLSMGRCLCALAKLLEVAVAYYRDKEFYVRVALTMENPELFGVLTWTPGRKLSQPAAKNVQDLSIHSMKVQQSGLQPMEYLTRGLAGAMLPESGVAPQAAGEFEKIGRGVLVRSGIYYKLPDGSRFTGQFVAQTTKGMQETVAHILYMVCCFIVRQLAASFANDAKPPEDPPYRHHWALYHHLFPGDQSPPDTWPGSPHGLASATHRISIALKIIRACCRSYTQRHL